MMTRAETKTEDAGTALTEAENRLGPVRGSPSVPITLRLVRMGLRSVGALSPQLAGRWAYRLWFRTHRFPEPKRETQWRGQSRQRTLDHDHGPLAVYDWGEGPTVLLVHGWNGRGTQLGAFAESLAAVGYRAVAFDAPGHGRTPGKQTTIFRIIDAMEAVACEAGPVAGIVAHSFGGMVVARALRTNAMAARVVCVSPSAQMGFLVESFSSTLHLPSRTRQTFEQLLEKDFGAHIWTEISADVNAAALSVPALIIHDEDDREVPWQQGECLAKAWPGARFILTRRLGHRRILYDRDVVDTTVRFLADADELRRIASR